MIRLRACWVVHSPVGCRVMPMIRMRRVAVLDYGQDVGLRAVE
jgi:hypothetical protein